MYDELFNITFVTADTFATIRPMNTHDNDPLYGKTLKLIIEHLVEQYGWEELGANIKIKCFLINPSISSSLKFLRRTPWAREKVEELYIATINSKPRIN